MAGPRCWLQDAHHAPSGRAHLAGPVGGRATFANAVRFDVYDRLQLEVLRHSDGSDGERRLRQDLVLSPGLPEADAEQALEDLLHEAGSPERVVRRVDGTRPA